jgi:hypothetical protein
MINKSFQTVRLQLGTLPEQSATQTHISLPGWIAPQYTLADKGIFGCFTTTLGLKLKPENIKQFINGAHIGENKAPISQALLI